MRGNENTFVGQGRIDSSGFFPDMKNLLFVGGVGKKMGVSNKQFSRRAEISLSGGELRGIDTSYDFQLENREKEKKCGAKGSSTLRINPSG